MRHLPIQSKLPEEGISVFARMTALANQHGAINLAQGFPNFNPPEALFNFMYEGLRNGYNQYAAMPGLPGLRQIIQRRLKDRYNYDANPETEITVTAGATQALYTVISAFIQTGDKAIIFEPAYDSYGPAIKLNGGEPIYLQLELPDFSIPWEKLEAIIKKEAVRLIIINNPHNPAGRILSESDLIKFKKLCAHFSGLFIWDEVYDLLVFDGKVHNSALLYPEIMQQSCVIFSMGKTLHNTGWKVGYTIAPEEISKEIRKVHQFLVFSVNTPSQYAIYRFMESFPNFVNELPEFYQAKRDYFFEQMKKTSFEWMPCEGSYFALARHPRILKVGDEAFAAELVERFKVAAIPISPFYHNRHDPGMLRFCFAKDEKTIYQAAQQLAALD